MTNTVPSTAELNGHGEDILIVIRRYQGWPMFVPFPRVDRVARVARLLWRGVLEAWDIVRFG